MGIIGWAAGSLKTAFAALVDFIYPPLCVVCGAPIAQGLVCARCLVAASAEPLPTCPRCGHPRKSDRPCAFCAGPGLAVSRVRALGSYRPPFETLVTELKYQGRRSLAPILGRRLARLLTADTTLAEADLVVPIPLHPARRRERGYNQSELLARVVGAETGILVLDCLARRRNTRTQTALGPSARFANVADAFAVRPGYAVAGRRVVLIDDVMTSGATLDAAARALRAAGAAAVWGLVVAAAGPDQRVSA